MKVLDSVESSTVAVLNQTIMLAHELKSPHQNRCSILEGVEEPGETERLGHRKGE
jgi:hypothetical protein